MTLMKLRLNFLFTDLSQHFRIYLVVFALKFFIHIGMGKSLCHESEKGIQPLPKHKNINFQNLVSLNKKLLSCLADFGWLKRVVGSSESVEKRKFVKKIFFQKRLD